MLRKLKLKEKTQLKQVEIMMIRIRAQMAPDQLIFISVFFSHVGNYIRSAFAGNLIDWDFGSQDAESVC